MNVLFVCTQNVGRSQMAAAFYNALADDGYAAGAGTKVDHEGETLAERAHEHPVVKDVLIVMREEGIDLSQSKRHNITQDMLDLYDQIIVMAEPDTVPQYLHDNAKALYWKVASPPFDAGVGGLREVRDDIKRKVVDLLQAE